MFEINPTKYYKLLNNEILSETGTIPLISNMSINNGVMGYSSLPANNQANSISCSDTTLGAETMYYQEREYIGYQHIQSFLPRFSPFNKKIALFIISSSRVATSSAQYDYGHKFNRDEMRKTIIRLPQTGNGEIDFDFMESFVAELEARRVAELEAYLLATGLKDYALTEEERNALDNYRTLKWSTYNLEELFGKSTRGKRLKGDDRIAGTLPFVTAGEACEGISAFIGNKVKIFESNTATIDMFGSAKYRNYRYGADDHVAVVHTEKIAYKAAIFTTSAIHKAAHTGKFDYGHNFYAKDADALDIMLPERDGLPDYKYMETLISAIQKLVIKDVVLYADLKIAETKAIITK